MNNKFSKKLICCLWAILITSNFNAFGVSPSAKAKDYFQKATTVHQIKIFKEKNGIFSLLDEKEEYVIRTHLRNPRYKGNTNYIFRIAKKENIEVLNQSLVWTEDLHQQYYFSESEITANAKNTSLELYSLFHDINKNIESIKESSNYYYTYDNSNKYYIKYFSKRNKFTIRRIHLLYFVKGHGFIDLSTKSGKELIEAQDNSHFDLDPSLITDPAAIAYKKK